MEHEQSKYPVVITGHGAQHYGHGHGGHGHGHSTFCHTSCDNSDILADIRADIGDIRSEVKDVEGEIKDSIQKLTLAQSLEFRHLNDKICETKEETIRQGLENKLKSEENKGFITKEIGDKICSVENTLREMRQAAIQDRLDDAQDEVAALRTSASTASVVAAVLAAIGLPTPAIKA